MPELKNRYEECINPSWRTKLGTPTHYCIGGRPGIDCPPPLHGCRFAQFKPVYHRMQKHKAKQDSSGKPATVRIVANLGKEVKQHDHRQRVNKQRDRGNHRGGP